MQQSNASELPLNTSYDPTATWVISDGRAGNERQAESLAQLLGRTPTKLIVKTAAPWKWFAPRVVPFAAHAFEEPLRSVLLGQAAAPELVIGCGRQAALATRLLRARGAYAIQTLNPRLDPSHWDIVIAPEHDGLQGANVLTLPGSIHAITPGLLDAVASSHHPIRTMPSPRVALLIGGDTHKQEFDIPEFAEVLQAVHDYVAVRDGSLLASTSRRTPDAVVAVLRSVANEIPSYVWTGDADAKRFRESPHNPYLAFLALSDAIVCSADSVSMLSEAAVTGVPLLLYGDTQSDDAPARFARQLIKMGRAHPWTTGLERDVGVTPLRTNADLVTRLQALAATLPRK